MRVLLVTAVPVTEDAAPFGGGMSVRLAQWCTELGARHEVRVVTGTPHPHTVTGAPVTVYAAAPVAAVQGTLPSFAPCWSNARLLWQGVAWSDVVVCTFHDVIAPTVLLARVLRKPVLFNLHTDCRGWALRGVARALPDLDTVQRWLTRGVQCVGSAGGARDRADRRARGFRVDLHYAPVAVPPVPQLGEASAALLSSGCGQRRVALWAGRWSRDKRVPLLAAAMQHVPDTTLVVVGDGVEPLEQLRSPHCVVRRGWVPRRELQALIAAADVVVNACDSETFGNLCHEARAQGTAAIVQAAGGHLQQRGPGVCLVDFEDRAQVAAAFAAAGSIEEAAGAAAASSIEEAVLWAAHSPRNRGVAGVLWACVVMAVWCALHTARMACAPFQRSPPHARSRDEAAARS